MVISKPKIPYAKMLYVHHIYSGQPYKLTNEH